MDVRRRVSWTLLALLVPFLPSIGLAIAISTIWAQIVGIAFWLCVGAVMFLWLWRAMHKHRALGIGVTHNEAFDKWFRVQLARLREERFRLDEAQRKFCEYQSASQLVRDQEELQRFLTRPESQEKNEP